MDTREPRLTRRQAQIMSAYTGTLCCDMALFQEIVEELIGRNVHTVEFSDDSPEGVRAELERKVKPLFMEIAYEGK